jgi:hypothetical protein
MPSRVRWEKWYASEDSFRTGVAGKESDVGRTSFRGTGCWIRRLKNACNSSCALAECPGEAILFRDVRASQALKQFGISARSCTSHGVRGARTAVGHIRRAGPA